MLNTDSYYLRTPDVVVVGTAEHYLFINVDGSTAHRCMAVSARSGVAPWV